MREVRLDGPTDIDGFRRAARALALAGVPAAEVRWCTGEAPQDLFAAAAGPHPCPLPQAGEGVAPLVVPASFLALCRGALLHAHPQRFTLMYRLLLRLQAEPDLWRDPLDADRRRAEQLAREVRHEIHKTHAFVRFVPVEDADGERLVAWFEPAHHTLEAAAPFFARRFANLRWAILSPRCSVSWDGHTLETGPGGRREDAPPPDAGAALWLTYYRSIFNPARLKVAMMEREMPRRYWANLPEAALIEPLVAQAGGRVQAMLAAEPTSPRRIREIERPRRSSAATPTTAKAQVEGSGAGEVAADNA